MSHLSLLSSVSLLALSLMFGAGAANAAPLPVLTSHESLATPVRGGGGFGGGHFGGGGDFARGGDRAIADDVYHGDRYWGGAGYIGGGYDYPYGCGTNLADWPRGTCDQF